MSEEMKNLNEQPEQAPVEEKVEAKKPLDKKTIAIIAGAAAAVLVLVLVLVLTLGGNKGPVVNDYTLGMGAVVSINNTNAQVDGTIAAVVLDKDGKIVLCRIDAIQNKVTINDDGTFAIGNTKTKAELKEGYNMAAFGHSLIGNETVLEWYKQAEAFEAWCVGKTIDQVKNMATQTMENGYVISADEALLAAGCTISITDFVDAVVKAGNDEFKVSFQTAGTVTLGLAINSADTGSTAATAEKEGAIKVHSDFAASAVVDGKIVASLNDAIQPQSNFDITGKVTTTSYKGTKRELKEGYNMAAFGHSLIGNETVKEWYLQSAAFSAHVVGMTGEQVSAMGTQTMENGYVISNDQTLLDAGCTIQITGIKAVVAKSVVNAH